MNIDNKQILKDLSEFLAIKSLQGSKEKNAPFGKAMRQTLDWFIDKAKSYRLNAYEHNGYYGVAEVGSGNDMIGIACHIDTVGATGDGWIAPPFSLTQKDGYLYGRGVVDNKGPAIVCLHILKALKDNKVDLKKRVRLIVGCNEESGSLCLKEYAKREEIPNLTIVPDADFPVINSEKGILHIKLELPIDKDFGNKISKLSFGSEFLNMIPDTASCVLDKKPLKFMGIAGHAMAPEKADNAAHKLFEKLSSVSQTAKIIYNLFCNDNSKKILELDYKCDKSGNLTMSLNKGELVKDKLILCFDFRLPLNCSDKTVIDKIKDKVPNSKITTLAYKKNHYIDPNNCLVKSLLKIYSDITGEKNTKPLQIGGGTYARELPNAIAFGATFPDTVTDIHNTNEKISMDNFNKWQDIYYKVAIELATKD